MAKTGVDDFLASGRTVAELKLLARPFNPEDLTAERLSRDDQLGAALEGLRAESRRMPAVRQAECSNLAVMRDFIRTAERSGKLVEDGVYVVRSARDGADGAQTSLGGWKNAVDRLEAAGRIRRDFWGRAKDKPGAYVLLTPWGRGSALGEQMEREARGGERQVSREEESFSQESSLSNAGFPAGVHVARAPFSGEVPELRWPKLVLTWERREGRRVVVDAQYVARLGKRRGEIIAYLFEAGGSGTVAELMERYGARRGRLRDFRRRILGPLEAESVITVDGEEAALTDAWREALEEARERTGEIEDARLQAERHDREKRAFRRAAKESADPTPETRGREHVRETLKRQRPRWAEQEADKRLQMVRPAEDFVRDILGRLPHVRLKLLESMWAERGGQRWHLRLALRKLRCTIKRHAEYPGELFVYSPPAVEAEEDAATPRKPYKRADGVYVHPPECACEWCEEAPQPSYARTRGAW
jgi:hypothetical protein